MVDSGLGGHAPSSPSQTTNSDARACYIVGMKKKKAPNKKDKKAGNVSEAAVVGDFVPLIEKALRRDGTIPIRIITSGWGSSGFYSREVLERDIPTAYPAGTHMYWNHPTTTEARERPERNLNHMAAKTIGEPHWQDNGPVGPGMYVDAEVYGRYGDAIDQLAGDIGVSIMGEGRVSSGVAEGREGTIVEEISVGKSIDFVTKPGAGGAIVELFESARGGGKLPSLMEQSRLGDFLIKKRDEMELTNEDLAKAAGVDVSTMQSILSGEIERPPDARLRGLAKLVNASFAELIALLPSERQEPEGVTQGQSPREAKKKTEEENMKLKEAQDQLAEATKNLAERDGVIAQMRQKMLLIKARDASLSVLSAGEFASLHESTRQRIVEVAVSSAPVNDAGELDKSGLETAVKEAAKKEVAYLAEVLGSGRVTGMGGNHEQDDPDDEQIKESMVKSFVGMGLSESAAKEAARGRN